MWYIPLCNFSFVFLFLFCKYMLTQLESGPVWNVYQNNWNTFFFFYLQPGPNVMLWNNSMIILLHYLSQQTCVFTELFTGLWMKNRILLKVFCTLKFFKNATVEKDNKKCIRPTQNNWTYSRAASRRLTITHTRGDIKGFLITAGKVSKLVKIIPLNTVVVSSYHHPHETYTEKCWLASRLRTAFMDPSDG